MSASGFPDEKDHATAAGAHARLRELRRVRSRLELAAAVAFATAALAAIVAGLSPWWLVAASLACGGVAWWSRRDVARAAFSAIEALESERRAAVFAATSKAQFLANMSHEIRTPMNGVLGMAELLVRTPLDSEQAQMASTIQASAEALLAVLNDILDYSKIEAGKLQLEDVDFDVWQLVDECAGLLNAAAAQKGVEMLTFTDPRLARQLVGDVARLRQIVLNFLGNAVKFTLEGEVVLSAELVAEDERSQTVRIAVRDTGVGIDRKVLEQLFQPFAQADASTTRRFGGTGLGLTICRRLAELMGGEILVESRAGVGSEFAVQLVLTKGEGQGQAPEPSPKIDFSEHAVLIVDDNETNRQLMQMQLAPVPIGLDVADNAVGAIQALRLAAARGRPFTMAILDMAMPGIDGMQLAEAIRNDAAIPALSIAIASSLGLSPSAEALERIDVFRWLNKPLSARRLLQVIGDMARLQRHAPLRSGADGAGVGGAADAIVGMKVLVAEDNEINRRVLAGMLRRLGCEVVFAVDGVEVVRLAAADAYDVVLMDCQMPELDGFGATRQIRAQGQEMPIVALTANVLQSDRDACMEAGMDDFLGKPVKLDVLRATLSRWRRGRAIGVAAAQRS
ncbi:MAG: response regulator [Planctomycetes bacterium]|nr:response regulator [Planctomycetota bacterium]